MPLLKDEDRQRAKLTLQECIHRALQFSHDIQAATYSPAVAMTDIVEAEAAFDAVLFGSASYDNTDTANRLSTFTTKTNVSNPDTPQSERIPTDPYNRTHEYAYSLGLQKRLPTGASIELSENLTRYRDLIEDSYYLNPYYEYELDLQFRQPLLRDFGLDLNQAGINAARNRYKISQQQFQLQVVQLVANVESGFWSLVMARQQMRIYGDLVTRSEQTLDRLLARETFDAGSSIIARNQGLIARARANLLSARNTVLSRQDDLLSLLNDPALPIEGDWEIIPMDPPLTSAYHVDRQEALTVAMSYRPEIIAQRLQLDTAQLAVGVADNQRLPRLDLVARQRTLGAGYDYDDALDRQGEMDTLSYGLGLSFEIPLGNNRGAQAGYMRARHQLRQQELGLQSVIEQVQADVSSSVNNLENVYKEISVRKQSAGSEYHTLQAYLAEENSDVKITADFLNRKLDAQERLASAYLVTARPSCVTYCPSRMCIVPRVRCCVTTMSNWRKCPKTIYRG